MRVRITTLGRNRPAIQDISPGISRIPVSITAKRSLGRIASSVAGTP